MTTRLTAGETGSAPSTFRLYPATVSKEQGALAALVLAHWSCRSLHLRVWNIVRSHHYKRRAESADLRKQQQYRKVIKSSNTTCNGCLLCGAWLA